MATEVIMPKLGQTMETGVITEWLVEEGQPVRRGDALFQVESDKAVLDVNAPATGLLRRILVPKGGTAPILTPVGVIGAADEDISAIQAVAVAPTAAKGTPAAKVEPAAPSRPTPVAAKVVEETASERGRVFASPRARRLARLEGIEVEGLSGSGPDGRIVEADVRAYLERVPPMTPAARAEAERLGLDPATLALPEGSTRLTLEDVQGLGAPVAVPTIAAPEPEAERIPMAGIRARIAAKMAESAHTTAAFTLTTEAEAGSLMAWRESLKRRAGEGGRVPTYNDLLIRLLARALAQHPEVNARLEGEEIARYRQANIGLAVDTERGLVVPVVRDAGALTLAGIVERTGDLVVRARTGQLTPDDMSGGTFTISNLGMYGVDAFTPIINVPEAAILGVGQIAERAVVRQGQIVARPIVILSLTVDHRVVDGAPAARFLQTVKELIEEPLLAL